MKIYFLISAFVFISFSAYSQKDKKKDEYRNEGFFNITKFGFIHVNEAKLRTFAIGEGVINTKLPLDNSVAYSLQTINGYFFGPYFSAGLGVGLDGYKNPNYNTLPIFIDLRVYLDDDKSSPYVFLDYGMLAKIENGTNNGNMFNIGIGYKLPINKQRFMIVADISYSYKLISNDGVSVNKSQSRTQIKATMLSFGVIF